MSNLTFPVLSGLTWDVVKQPEFSTKIQTASSGKDTAAAWWTYPRWTFKLQYELLRGGSLTELNTLLGFFLTMQGQFDTFLYSDPSDNTVANQQIGIGDGTTADFQLVRTLGSFSEPMQNINGTPTIFVNGVQQEWWGVNSTGLVTFPGGHIPANGAIVTANFSYYFRCRFLKDVLEFNQFMKDLWEAKKVEFISVKS